MKINSSTNQETNNGNAFGTALLVLVLFVLTVWFVTGLFLMVMGLIFSLFKKTSIKKRTRKIFMLLIPGHGIITLYIYLILVLFYFSEYFSFKTVGYIEGTVLILGLMTVPLLLYYFYFEILPKELLISNKIKNHYQLIIPSDLEQSSIRSKGLIILYSLDSKNFVLCEKEYLKSKDELYIYDKEKDKFYCFLKIKVLND
jgi:hypothetical protein